MVGIRGFAAFHFEESFLTWNLAEGLGFTINMNHQPSRIIFCANSFDENWSVSSYDRGWNPLRAASRYKKREENKRSRSRKDCSCVWLVSWNCANTSSHHPAVSRVDIKFHWAKIKFQKFIERMVQFRNMCFIPHFRFDVLSSNPQYWEPIQHQTLMVGFFNAKLD